MHKEVLLMGAPSMEPVVLEFDSEKEARDFVNWAESEEKDNSSDMQRIKDMIARVREMRNTGRQRV